MSQVDVQTGSATAPWYKASGPYSPTQGSQGWSFIWPLPISDSVPVRFRARATDAAGNLGPLGRGRPRPSTRLRL